MNIYQKIWTKYNGPIPKDDDGRFYEIHHKDGNRSNNNIDNLQCVSIKKHYEIHQQQNDIGACQAIILRMNISPEKKSELASFYSKKQIENGTNNFLNLQTKLINEGRHNFSPNGILRKRLENGIHHFQSKDFHSINAKKQVEKGNHNFLGGKYQKEMLEKGTHPSQKYHVCPHCGKKGKGMTMFRYHFDKCKFILPQ